MRNLLSNSELQGDPPGCRYDMHAVPEPQGTWAYEIDDRGICYGAGNWPYTRDDGAPWGVMLTPDVKYWAWRNQIVLARPTGEHTATALLHLYARPYGTGAILFDLEVAINLVTGNATVPTYCPHQLRGQAEIKAQRVAGHLGAARTDRAHRRAPVTAHDRWQATKTNNPNMTGQQPDDMQPIDWATAAVRQHQHNKDLIYQALRGIGPLDPNEIGFVSRIAYDGGFLELASLAEKVRTAASAAPPARLDRPS